MNFNFVLVCKCKAFVYNLTISVKAKSFLYLNPLLATSYFLGSFTKLDIFILSEIVPL